MDEMSRLESKPTQSHRGGEAQTREMIQSSHAGLRAQNYATTSRGRRRHDIVYIWHQCGLNRAAVGGGRPSLGTALRRRVQYGQTTHVDGRRRGGPQWRNL